MAAGQKELEIVVRARVVAEAALKSLKGTLGTLGHSMGSLGKAAHLASSGMLALGRHVVSLLNPFRILTGVIRGLAIHLGVIFGVGGIAAVGYVFARVVTSVVGFGKSVLDTGGQMQMFKVRLTALLGSAKAAAEEFKYMSDVARTTPFTLPQVVEAGVTLRSFGESNREAVKAMADLAAYMGETMPIAASAYGRAFAGGLGASEILRERGVLTLIRDFAKLKYGINDLAKVSKQKFREILYAAITDITGPIAGATSMMSKMWLGLLSNIEDAWTRFKLAIAEAGFLEFASRQAEDLLEWMERLEATGELAVIAKKISDAFIDASARVVEWVRSFTLDDVIEKLKEIRDIIAGLLHIGKVVIEFVVEGADVLRTLWAKAETERAIAQIRAYRNALLALGDDVKDFPFPSMLREMKEGLEALPKPNELPSITFGMSKEEIQDAQQRIDTVGKQYEDLFNKIGWAAGQTAEQNNAAFESMGDVWLAARDDLKATAEIVQQQLKNIGIEIESLDPSLVDEMDLEELASYKTNLVGVTQAIGDLAKGVAPANAEIQGMSVIFRAVAESGEVFADSLDRVTQSTDEMLGQMSIMGTADLARLAAYWDAQEEAKRRKHVPLVEVDETALGKAISLEQKILETQIKQAEKEGDIAKLRALSTKLAQKHYEENIKGARDLGLAEQMRVEELAEVERKVSEIVNARDLAEMDRAIALAKIKQDAAQDQFDRLDDLREKHRATDEQVIAAAHALEAAEHEVLRLAYERALAEEKAAKATAVSADKMTELKTKTEEANAELNKMPKTVEKVVEGMRKSAGITDMFKGAVSDVFDAITSGTRDWGEFFQGLGSSAGKQIFGKILDDKMKFDDSFSGNFLVALPGVVKRGAMQMAKNIGGFFGAFAKGKEVLDSGTVDSAVKAAASHAEAANVAQSAWSNAFSSIVGMAKGAFGIIAQIMRSVIGDITGSLSQLWSGFGQLISQMRGAGGGGGGGGSAWQGILGGVIGLAGSYFGLSGIGDLIAGDFKGALLKTGISAILGKGIGASFVSTAQSWFQGNTFMSTLSRSWQMATKAGLTGVLGTNLSKWLASPIEGISNLAGAIGGLTDMIGRIPQLWGGAAMFGGGALGGAQMVGFGTGANAAIDAAEAAFTGLGTKATYASNQLMGLAGIGTKTAAALYQAGMAAGTYTAAMKGATATTYLASLAYGKAAMASGAAAESATRFGTIMASKRVTGSLRFLQIIGGLYSMAMGYKDVLEARDQPGGDPNLRMASGGIRAEAGVMGIFGATVIQLLLEIVAAAIDSKNKVSIGDLIREKFAKEIDKVFKGLRYEEWGLSQPSGGVSYNPGGHNAGLIEAAGRGASDDRNAKALRGNMQDMMKSGIADAVGIISVGLTQMFGEQSKVRLYLAAYFKKIMLVEMAEFSAYEKEAIGVRRLVKHFFGNLLNMFTEYNQAQKAIRKQGGVWGTEESGQITQKAYDKILKGMDRIGIIFSEGLAGVDLGKILKDHVRRQMGTLDIEGWLKDTYVQVAEGMVGGAELTEKAAKRIGDVFLRTAAKLQKDISSEIDVAAMALAIANDALLREFKKVGKMSKELAIQLANAVSITARMIKAGLPEPTAEEAVAYAQGAPTPSKRKGKRGAFDDAMRRAIYEEMYIMREIVRDAVAMIGDEFAGLELAARKVKAARVGLDEMLAVVDNLAEGISKVSKKKKGKREKFAEALTEGLESAEKALQDYIVAVQEQAQVQMQLVDQWRAAVKAAKDFALSMDLEIAALRGSTDTAKYYAAALQEANDAMANIETTEGLIAGYQTIMDLERKRAAAEIADLQAKAAAEIDVLNKRKEALGIERDNLNKELSGIQAIANLVESIRTQLDELRFGAMSGIDQFDRIEGVSAAIRTARGAVAGATGEEKAAAISRLQDLLKQRMELAEDAYGVSSSEFASMRDQTVRELMNLQGITEDAAGKAKTIEERIEAIDAESLLIDKDIKAIEERLEIAIDLVNTKLADTLAYWSGTLQPLLNQQATDLGLLVAKEFPGLTKAQLLSMLDDPKWARVYIINKAGEEISVAESTVANAGIGTGPGGGNETGAGGQPDLTPKEEKKVERASEILANLIEKLETGTNARVDADKAADILDKAQRIKGKLKFANLDLTWVQEIITAATGNRNRAVMKTAAYLLRTQLTDAGLEQGGISLKDALRRVSEGNKAEAVLPLQNPQAMDMLRRGLFGGDGVRAQDYLSLVGGARSGSQSVGTSTQNVTVNATVIVQPAKGEPTERAKLFGRLAADSFEARLMESNMLGVGTRNRGVR